MPKLFEELRVNKVKPIVAIYCTTANGRVDTKLVTDILKRFNDQKIKIIFVITNKYSMNEEQFKSQMTEGLGIMREVSRSEPFKHDSFSYSFADNYLCAVNSKPFQSMMGTRNTEGIDDLMENVVKSLSEESLIEFFIATINNRDIWTKMMHSVEGLANKMKNGMARMGIKMDDLIYWIKGVGGEVLKWIRGLF